MPQVESNVGGKDCLLLPVRNNPYRQGAKTVFTREGGSGAHSAKQRPLWSCAKGLVFIDTCKGELRGQGRFQVTHMILKFALCSCHYGLYTEAFPPGNGIIDF